jgi:DNA-binding NarL/FixJ family response regulator
LPGCIIISGKKMSSQNFHFLQIGSDVYLVSHLRGRQHQEAVKLQLGGKDVSREELEVFSLRHITDAPASNTDRKLAMDRERQKALKKRCKKIRLRMATK